jgi:ribosomal protein L32
MAKHLSGPQRRPSMARRKKRRIGAFSRRLTFSDLDARTNAGKYVNSIKNGLEAQIGTRARGSSRPTASRVFQWLGEKRPELIVHTPALARRQRLDAGEEGAVTLKTARAAGTGPVATLLMRAIQRDEARWCAVLAGHFHALGETLSVKVGAFYDKAMPIADLGERIAFLNRGQVGRAKTARDPPPRPR